MVKYILGRKNKVFGKNYEKWVSENYYYLILIQEQIEKITKIEVNFNNLSKELYKTSDQYLSYI